MVKNYRLDIQSDIYAKISKISTSLLQRSEINYKWWQAGLHCCKGKVINQFQQYKILLYRILATYISTNLSLSQMVSDDSEECSFLKSSEIPVFQANSQPCPLLVIANILQGNFEPMSSSDSWTDSQTTILKLTRLLVSPKPKWTIFGDYHELLPNHYSISSLIKKARLPKHQRLSLFLYYMHNHHLAWYLVHGEYSNTYWTKELNEHWTSVNKLLFLWK